MYLLISRLTSSSSPSSSDLSPTPESPPSSSPDSETCGNSKGFPPQDISLICWGNQSTCSLRMSNTWFATVGSSSSFFFVVVEVEDDSVEVVLTSESIF